MRHSRTINPASRRASRRSIALLTVAGLVAALFGALGAPAAIAAEGTTVRVTDPDFSTTGTWLVSAVLGPDGEASRYTTSTGATATWRLTAPAAGVYRVEVAIPDTASSDANAHYTLSGGAGADVNVIVSQTTTRGNWASVGLVDLEAGEDATLTLLRSGSAGGANTRAASARMVPDSGTVEPVETGLPFSDDHQDGLADWLAVGTSDLGAWSSGAAEFDYLRVTNTDSPSGSYLRPESPIDLPQQYRIRLSAKVENVAAGTVSILTDMQSPYAAATNNTAVQFTPAGVRIARPNGGTPLCTGATPMTIGEWFQLEIVRAGGIVAVSVNGELVASVTAGASGGSVALGAYRAVAEFGGIGIEELAEVPTDHPTTAAGCAWTPSTGVGSAQPVIINQTGYDIGGPKRFTAPMALDGEIFEIVDSSDALVFNGTIAGGVGDFSEFDPVSTGPYRVLVEGSEGEGESYEFGIGANWTERVTYRNAVAFMTDARCFWGELAGKPLNGTHSQCRAGLAWRDSHQMSFEIPALVDLYFANPSAIGAITVPEAVYQVEYPTSAGTPEIVRLIAWGAEIHLRGQHDHVLVKEQLASFLWAYPELAEWIPVELYEDVRDYLFPIWDQASYSRYGWHEYTAHTADLLQVYTQLGTGKGDFPIGHSIIPNLRMWEVAQREGRANAAAYQQAAIAQAEWILDNVDVAEPLVTKGQRQAEYHLMTSLATLAATLPDAVIPAGLGAFAQQWATVAIDRSDNLWDFRRYSDDRWTIPSFTGGASGDPNETGNLLGFPAAALATTTLIDDAEAKARLIEIAQAQVDNIFGRNPTGRAAQYRAKDPVVGFEGLDLGWFSEYQGGYGLLQGSHGVFDGSPKNGHYPFNPGTGNIGHTEGWVTFNTAWLETLAWRAHTSTAVSLDAAAAPVDGAVAVTLRAPLNMDAAGGNAGTLRVSVDGERVTELPVVQTGVNALDYTGILDLAALDLPAGAEVTVSYGLGSFTRSASLTVESGGEQELPRSWAALNGRTVTLSAGEAAAHLEYAIDGGEWIRYSAPFLVEGTGSAVVAYRGVTDLGAAGPEGRVTVASAEADAIVALDPLGVAKTVLVGEVVTGFGARATDTAGAGVRGSGVEFTVAGGVFAGGETTLVVETNAAGIAVAPGATATTEGSLTITARIGDRSVTLPVVTVVAPAPSPDAEASVITKTVSGRVVLEVSVLSTGAEPATIKIATRYGTKTFTSVAPGTEVSTGFNTFMASIPTGAVTITVIGDSGTSAFTAIYEAN